jgi:hypothetical protein
LKKIKHLKSFNPLSGKWFRKDEKRLSSSVVVAGFNPLSGKWFRKGWKIIVI